MNNNSFKISGNIVDVVNKAIFTGTVEVTNGIVTAVRHHTVNESQYILPGLVDAHVHIESSMLIPSEFARMAVVHGTVGTVSDPHEIANVMGVPGVKFMIANGKKVPFKFNFGAPSCVPATSFETAGAVLGVEEVGELLGMPEIKYLSEMMNFPGVLFNNPEVMAKIELAKKAGKPVDGHAPGLKGADAAKYISAGISTDHECFTLDEARDKIGYGMHVLIREGSAAKNFETLYPLINEVPEMVMLCSDDKHPDDLLNGHINEVVKRAVACGCDVMNVLRSCTFNPVIHYRLDIGLLQPGDPADLIVVDNLRDFNVLATWVDGVKVAENGKSNIVKVIEEPFNHFEARPVKAEDLEVPARGERIRVIEAYEGQLITGNPVIEHHSVSRNIVSDPSRDLLKIVVLNRYRISSPAIGFIRGIGLKQGAIASCVAHDSHNIIAVGADDDSIMRAINMVIGSQGGIALVNGEQQMVLPLSVGGIMSPDEGPEVARKYQELDREARKLGSPLTAPYMTLSFMALLVIPSLKLSDKGLFDGQSFSFVDLFE
jgi:adenine deaminase